MAATAWLIYGQAMRRPFAAYGILLALILTGVALASVALASAPAKPESTEIVRWSPFDARGFVKKTLRVHPRGTGRCSDTYTTAGDIAYRCDHGHFLLFPCWRDGPNPTEFVLCIGTPWTSSVEKLRSPGLLLYPGVTYLDNPYSPWAIELAGGERCRLVQGAHDAIHRGTRTYVVDYGCDRDDLVLLRNLRRGRVWRIGAARYINLKRGFKLLGDRVIRRAFFGGLPPPMEHQRKLAARAVATARLVIHQKASHAHLDLAWVRLALPDAQWAYVLFSSTDGKGWFALLHREDGRWVDASSYKPYCGRLPQTVRRQLFLGPKTWNPAPYWSQAAPGEQRC
jgi:hypothetical protein